MITDVIYCPECGRCYHCIESSSLGCGHKIASANRINIRSKKMDGYEWVSMRRMQRWPFSFLVRPDGSVEWRNRVYSAEAWEEKLARHYPLYPAAFRARWDIEIFKRIPEHLVEEGSMEYATKLLEFVIEHRKKIVGVAVILAGLAVELARKWQDVQWVAEKLMR